MKQLLILSGKGGTGKTTVAGAIIRLAQVLACADCDVDAPNLHLILNHEGDGERKDYFGLPKAFIDQNACTMCGRCSEMCRFNAVDVGERTAINGFACEGCGLCEAICPENAIEMQAVAAGDLRLFKDEEKGVFSTAQLRMGNGTSGLLVTQVKNQLKNAAAHLGFAVIDGSPGIGCPVIASLSGADMVLVVTEPSMSGFSDMERILDTAKGLRADTAVCVNKADLNPKITEKIKIRCEERNVPYVGEIPYDPIAVKAVNDGLTVAEVKCPAGDAVRDIFHNVMEVFDGRRRV